MDFRFLGCARNDIVGAQKDVAGAQRDVVEAQEDTDWGGDDGQCGLLAAGEAGIFRFPLISSHFLPFGGCFEGPFDRDQDRFSTNGGEVFRLRG